RRRAPTPGAPSERGRHAGRPYWLWLPASRPPWPAIVIIHGASSRKENHADFARAAAAMGWAALCFDQRGHGESEDEMAPAALGDVTRMARMLAEREEVDVARICARGSSMGGFMAIHAAATSDLLAGVIAICPAGERSLAEGFRQGRFELRCGEQSRRSMIAWLGELDLRDAVELLGSKPLLLAHAAGDQQVPSSWSAELYEHAHDPRKLLLLPGGSHRSVQHDPEIQAVSLSWLRRNLPG
ncbi:MAG: alpha/beta hydrolase, partial [Solirubrobacterales bacterium]|nr:alpha/beta hydrolase [Solirubrobacterales bacterium]